MTEEERALVDAIWARYGGKLDTLDCADPAVRAQLAFDVGWLLGIVHRLWRECDEQRAELALLRHERDYEEAR